ncbi:hypothetical protein RvY_09954-1 [Ramazzottius varieornatus]|uniref:Uncharacterized protein n=1 Tax=Ramazzottius varieornatus TaxID=947166 RepID=A0A1D1VD97_RAMVA|nr:hypothetical protein RvY_09954-1 [Ramazzottius varieornatus]
MFARFHEQLFLPVCLFAEPTSIFFPSCQLMIILNVFALDKYITTVCSCCLKVHHRDSSLPFPSSFNSSQIYKCLRSDTGYTFQKMPFITDIALKPEFFRTAPMKCLRFFKEFKV